MKTRPPVFPFSCLHNGKSRMVRASAVFVLAALTPSVRAGNIWTGNGATNDWSDVNNWGGSAPAYGTLTFTTAGTQGTTSFNNSITDMNMLLWTGSLSWTMNGNTNLSLFDFGKAQAKIENQSTGLVTINAPVTFAATTGATFGEINAVNGNLTFGGSTLTVSGQVVNGIKLFGANRTTAFNNTVSASGKWFGLTGNYTTMVVGGSFTSGDIFVMNGGTLQLNSGGSISSSAIRLGGDFTTTGNQNQALGGTLQLTNLTGGQSVGSIINAVGGNTSSALLISSLNTSNTNTISGNIFLDSALKINQEAGGSLAITNATLDLKAQQLTLTGGGNIGITGIIGNSIGSGSVVIGVNGTAGGPTVTYSSANTYSGQTFVRAGTLAFNAGASAGNSTVRLGSTSGTEVDANINLSTLTGGTTLTTTINPVTTSGSGTLWINSQNTSGTNTLAGHLGLDRSLTITQAAGGTLNLTQTKGGDNTTGSDIKGHTLTLTSAASGTINHSGTIYNSTGNGAVTVNGPGVVTLSGINTYTGPTTVSAGTLIVGVNNVGSITSNVTVTEGATLGGSGIVSGNATIAGTHAPGNSPGIQTFENGLSYTSTGIFEWELTSNTTDGRGSSWDAVNLTTGGTMSVDPNATFKLVLSNAVDFSESFWNTTRFWNVFVATDPATITSVFQKFDVTGGQNYNPSLGSLSMTNNGTLTWTAVPEPSTALAGLLLCAGLLRRRRA